MNTQQLFPYINALRPILYIENADFKSVSEDIQKISKNARIFEFMEGLGAIDSKNRTLQKEQTLRQFLLTNKDEGYNQDTFFVLKDVHNSLAQPDIISLLKYIAERILYTEGYTLTVFILSCKHSIPKELEHLITLIPQDTPLQETIEQLIRAYANQLDFSIEESVVGELALELKGLSFFQIKQVLDLAYANGGMISKEDKAFVIQEKKQIIQKSGLLEFVDTTRLINSVGGLENLKFWLDRKAKIFKNLDRALKYGVDTPKGMLIVGFPGCGKSLVAKTTANQFGVPLLRLDVGKILGKYVGESEQNMRSALAQAEAISPCVLWIDEVEKAFGGGSSTNSHEVTTRLVGQFLTWMQEKTSTVFVVATANDLERLPTEFLRKGRFDEIFSVALPTPQERFQILKIHLAQRNQYFPTLNLSQLITKTNGYSGADIEAGVNIAVEDLFLSEDHRKKMSEETLLKAFEKIKPLSKALKVKFDSINNKLKEYEVRPAS